MAGEANIWWDQIVESSLSNWRMIDIRPTRNFDLEISFIGSKLQGLLDSYILLYKNNKISTDFLDTFFLEFISLTKNYV